jgi:hypothetical protein
MNDLTQRLQACYASAVHDVLRQMGQFDRVLKSRCRTVFLQPPKDEPMMPRCGSRNWVKGRSTAAEEILFGIVTSILDQTDPSGAAHHEPHWHNRLAIAV